MGVLHGHGVEPGPERADPVPVLGNRLAPGVSYGRLEQRVDHAGFHHATPHLVVGCHVERTLVALGGVQLRVCVVSHLQTQAPCTAAGPERLAADHGGSLQVAVGDA